jgi:hypothetical protein
MRKRLKTSNEDNGRNGKWKMGLSIASALFGFIRLLIELTK